jgi:hypothetical protein
VSLSVRIYISQRFFSSIRGGGELINAAPASRGTREGEGIVYKNGAKGLSAEGKERRPRFSSTLVLEISLLLRN